MGEREQYDLFLTEGFRAPSWLEAYVPWCEPESLAQRLPGDFDRSDEDRFELSVDGAAMSVRLSDPEPLDNLHSQSFDVTAADLTEAGRAGAAILVETTFGEDVLDDYHRQIRVLSELAPDAIVCHDPVACRLRSATWLHDAASASVPPPPHTLYTIHAVSDADSPHGAWLHTHGLMRCGTIELDMLAVPVEGASLLGDLMNCAATMFIEHGLPEPGEAVLVGHDIALMWLPWRDALGQCPRDALGQLDDRDDAHDGPRGVLFAPGRRGEPVAPSVHLPKLEDNPLLFVSDLETKRMSLLSKNQFPRFRAILRDHAGEEDWQFLVKIGILTDDGENNEHIWFDVHTLRGAEVDATCLNQPHAVSGLQEGQRGVHHVDGMSDWTIFSPFGSFNANNIGALERTLSER